MSSTKESAEAMALRGLLLLLVEVQNEVRKATADDSLEDTFTVIANIDAIVDSSGAREFVQLAQAALEAPPARKTFYGIVTQYDCSDKYREKHNGHRPEQQQGPIIFEQYLNEATSDRAVLEARARSMIGYGWVRVAQITVEIPSPTPVALPAASALVHE